MNMAALTSITGGVAPLAGAAGGGRVKTKAAPAEAFSSFLSSFSSSVSSSSATSSSTTGSSTGSSSTGSSSNGSSGGVEVNMTFKARD